MNFLTNLSTIASNAKFLISKNSPTILIGVGVVSFGATIFAACKNTVSAEKVLDEYAEAKQKIADAIDAAHDEDIPIEVRQKWIEETSEKNLRALRLKAFGKFMLGMIKNYAPTIILSILTITSFLASYRIINGRLTAAIGAYTALDEAYKRYQKRVVDAVGEEKEREIRTGIVNRSGFVKEVTPEGDNVINEKEVPMCPEQTNTDPQFVIWNEFSAPAAYRRGDPIYNEMFIHSVMTHFNHVLRTKGYVFEKDVREALGLEVTAASTFRGWILDPNNMPNELTYPIDFDIQPLFRETGETALATGRIVRDVSTREWGLTFNTVPIWDKIELWTRPGKNAVEAFA